MRYWRIWSKRELTARCWHHAYIIDTDPTIRAVAIVATRCKETDKSFQWNFIFGAHAYTFGDAPGREVFCTLNITFCCRPFQKIWISIVDFLTVKFCAEGAWHFLHLPQFQRKKNLGAHEHCSGDDPLYFLFFHIYLAPKWVLDGTLTNSQIHNGSTSLTLSSKILKNLEKGIY